MSEQTNNNKLPFLVLEQIVLKVKQLQDLTPDEEFIYLLHFENLPEEDARRIAYGNFQDNNLAD